MQLTSRIATICENIFHDGADVAALDMARRCLIDSIAAAYTAIGEHEIDILLNSLQSISGNERVTVVGYDRTMRAEEAALVMGTMISLQLYDDNSEQMRGHPSAPVWPAVLAVGEKENRTLKEALAAFVVGYEVECRLGMALNPSHYEIGWHATATQGTLAATVVSNLLLGLDVVAATHALGIAGSTTGGLRRNFGTMTMSFHSGVAASNGIRAARLAQLGFTADPDIFDGAMSLGAVFSREWSPAAFAESIDHWGKPLTINHPGPIFKLVPSGRPTVAAIECAMIIRNQHGVPPEHVKRIVCKVSYMYPRTLIHERPVTGLQGKTSLQYGIAAALLDRRLTLASFTDQAVRRPAIADLINKIEVRVPPELSEDMPDVRRAPFEQPVTVIVETVDGQKFSESVRYIRGSPQNPVSDDDLRNKFVDCLAPHLARAQIDALVDYIHEDGATVRGLFILLKKRQ